MIITFLNGKGGVGKSTSAMLVACALAQNDLQVGVIDKDDQGTATQWVHNLGMDNLRLLTKITPGFDHYIIDTPPLLRSPELVESLRSSEAALVVSSPSPADLYVSQRTAALVNEHLPDPQRGRLLFNQMVRNSVLSREVDSYSEVIGLQRMRNTLATRQSYQHAISLGFNALDATAKQEVLNLAIEILSI